MGDPTAESTKNPQSTAPAAVLDATSTNNAAGGVSKRITKSSTTMPDGSVVVTTNTESRFPDGSVCVETSEQTIPPKQANGASGVVSSTAPSSASASSSQHLAQAQQSQTQVVTSTTTDGATTKDDESTKSCWVRRRMLLIVLALLLLAGVAVAIVVPLVILKDDDDDDDAQDYKWNQVGGDVGENVGGGSSGIEIDGDIHLSRNGQRIAMELNDDPNQLEKIQIYENSGSNSDWTQVGNTIFTEDDSRTKFALNADGTRIVIGKADSSLGEYRQGRVRVLARSGSSSWSDQIGQVLEGKESYSRFGTSVSIDDSGNRIAVGARGTPTPNYSAVDFRGNVTVYDYDAADDEWKQVGPVITDLTGTVNFFGNSVELSGDGQRLEVGFLEDLPSNPGYMRITRRVYQLNAAGTAWTTMGQDSLSAYDQIDSGSLSYDGSIFAAGSMFLDTSLNEVNLFSDTDIGRARVLQYNAGSDTWDQLGQEIVGDAIGDEFGGVSLSSDGRRLAIRARRHANETGLVRIYDYVDGTDLSTWEKVGDDLVGDKEGDWFGCRAVLSGDGSRVAASACEGNYVRVFEAEAD